jgi:hypothetical protein
VRKLLGGFALVSSALLAVICVAAVKWYLFDVLIGLRGEPDRSMQFWGLAILFIGIWAGGAAVALAVLSRQLLTRHDPRHTNPDGQRRAVHSPSHQGGTA